MISVVYLFCAIGLFLGVAAYLISGKRKGNSAEGGLGYNQSSLFGSCDKACMYCPPECQSEQDVLDSLRDEDAVPFPKELYERTIEMVKDIDPGDLGQPLSEERLDGSNYIETRALSDVLPLIEKSTPKKKKAVTKNKNTSSKTKKTNKKAKGN